MTEKTLGQIAESVYIKNAYNTGCWEMVAQAVADHVRKDWGVEKFLIFEERNELSAMNADLENKLREVTQELDQLYKDLANVVNLKTTPVPQVQDDESLDGTDDAHPAWWRGHDAGVDGTIKRVLMMLDGKDDGGGTARYKEYQDMRKRILALVKRQHPATKFNVGDKGYIVTDDGKDIFSITIEEVFNAIRHKNENYKEYKVLSSAEAAEWVRGGGVK